MRYATALLLLSAMTTSLIASGCHTREIGSPSPPAGASQGAWVEVFSEDFSGQTLGPLWSRGVGEGGKGQWRVESGALVAQDIKNDPLWLKRPLPPHARVEFEATSLSDEGDLKFEIFGDGVNHSSGYVVIFGGWKNALDVIARLDEHGQDRLARPSIKVKPRQVHKLALERDEQGMRFYVDGKLVLTYNDPAPLKGASHQYFAFNDWTAPVRFDNLKVYERQPKP